MPSVSKKQRKLMAVAEHNPSAVSEKNKGVLNMSQDDMRDFAATPETNLPERKGHAPKRKRP